MSEFLIGRYLLAVGLLIIMTGQTLAKEFTANRVDDTTVFVIAAGEIASGDAERLMSVFLPLPRDGTNFLVLNSIGGSVIASEALAAAIRRLHVTVVVPGAGVCALSTQHKNVPSFPNVGMSLLDDGGRSGGAHNWPASGEACAGSP
jgi:hypothetical protein